MKAILLLSGGLDSTTTLYYAIGKGYQCHALIFDYGQKHRKEIRYAVAAAKRVSVAYRVVQIKLPWKGSSLLDPRHKKKAKGIPPTYVPARNTIFLSFALSYAEAIGAEAIFYGANAIDYSGYPDCRPEFVRAFQNLIKAGARDCGIKVSAPLIKKTKAQIVQLAKKLGVPIDKTWSCYEGSAKPCGVCDSCKLREKGLKG
ncbi:7-cyano-7-deazaguanine synthase QueC [candidate division WOR-1 bacterium RIFOXYA12_FULL_43_27]|uniref:7-cyano-7-deazaguanine synthase n=1 Tax=candidate division WOR-1 bacterium RIFOXYC2_FULL_46_14 TaxID=1802587 RepID=A0A1F4U6M4_UNCSA|nr:MAG: 7-cyano-7-deazaguanine synthase QueC [candidate division WOR-1 bacterium RIFOXYA12_FULL_43_27]OGC19563.1 MAG: 7-cyano-7-deazaguanine synthase QueC [candidate division WOR-1 bacterium RIFOXYB2_FULL_46_45]OGC30551.1 MAG: 7-cyano-7-deazaguanine synthase QueC [candidate division WOR-1 bacterium RIFOXYA2_FULL_46_56]OGC40618.1 MAG: 7-cyano-7-deazaguanine synthase QueC [candidate division WOR-1 bacterium RIFOXYC2_FULL_46_14]